MADDEGRALDDARLARAFAFPLDDDIATPDVEAMLGELHRNKLIKRYEVDGRRYLAVTNFSEHQHPKKKLPSKLPAPPVPHQFPTSGEEVPPVVGVGVGVGVGGEVSSVGKAAPPVPRQREAAGKYPDFPATARQDLHAHWTERLGTVAFPRLVAAVGPYWTADADHSIVRLAVRDYIGIVPQGRSAPFASPADLAKKLGALITNVTANAHDPVARVEGARMIVHGTARATP